MVSDRVGDFIIRLQNAALVGKREVLTPYSAHLSAIAAKLKQLGFIVSFETKEKDGVKRTLVVTLAYDEHGNAKMRGVKRVSKPGRRLYAPHTKTHTVKGGTGARILSTSAGILTDAEVRRKHIGGETMFEIW